MSKKKEKDYNLRIITNVFISKCNFNETPLLFIVLLFFPIDFMHSVFRWFCWLYLFHVGLFIREKKKTWLTTPIAFSFSFYHWIFIHRFSLSLSFSLVVFYSSEITDWIKFVSTEDKKNHNHYFSILFFKDTSTELNYKNSPPISWICRILSKWK